MLRSLLALAATLGVVNNAQRGTPGEKGAAGEKGEAGAPGAGVTLLFGRVLNSGSKVNGSAGWTVAKVETGVYKITITVPFASFSDPTVTALTGALGGRVGTVIAAQPGSFEVQFVEAGAKIDTTFFFHCTGG